jgi:hypothetical protein
MLGALLLLVGPAGVVAAGVAARTVRWVDVTGAECGAEDECGAAALEHPLSTMPARAVAAISRR